MTPSVTSVVYLWSGGGGSGRGVILSCLHERLASTHFRSRLWWRIWLHDVSPGDKEGSFPSCPLSPMSTAGFVPETILFTADPARP